MADQFPPVKPLPMGADERAERKRAEASAAANRNPANAPATPAETKAMQAEKAQRDMDKKMGEAYEKANRTSSVPGRKAGGKVARYAKGGSVSSRADGIAQRGRTRGKMC